MGFFLFLTSVLFSAESWCLLHQFSGNSAIFSALKEAERLKKIFNHSTIVEAAIVHLLFICAWIVLNPSVRKWFLTEQSVVT